MGTCETPNPPRLPSAALDPRCNTNCGSSMDGTVAVNTPFHQFFRRVAFLTRLVSRKARTFAKSTRTCDAGRCQRQHVAIKGQITGNPPPRSVRLGARASIRRGGGVCRSVNVNDGWFAVRPARLEQVVRGEVHSEISEQGRIESAGVQKSDDTSGLAHSRPSSWSSAGNSRSVWRRFARLSAL
jgi:hypothetical protein